MELSIDIQHYSMECHYAECRDYLNVMLSVVMLNVILLNVIMLNDVMLNVVNLSVVWLNVVMLSVVAPSQIHDQGPIFQNFLRP